MEKQWSRVLEIIKEDVSPANFRTWFSHSQPVAVKGSTLTISVPSGFVKNQLTSRYMELLDKGVTKVFEQALDIELIVDSKLANNQNDEEDLSLTLPPPTSHHNFSSNLNPKYTLENFVVGLSNNLAFAAAQAVSQNPGTTYNPLFIYGGTGVGKTHLMQGIGNVLLQKNSNLKIIYCSSEGFTNDFIQSIQTKKTGEFRNRYRSCDLLLMDDVQFLSGRDSTQEEFFHTFNELHTRNCQLILTSDRPPNDMIELESRLKSRFQGGLMVDIQTPDFDTRVAILRAKCVERGESVPEECLTIIASNMNTNARELEGKLIQIVQTAKLMNEVITPQFVQKLLGQAVASNAKPDYKKVILQINNYFSVKTSDLTGPRRKKELVIPRQMAMYLLYEECKLPYQRIGEILGGRDHTTILHGVEKVRESVLRDREVQRVLIELKQSLNA